MATAFSREDRGAFLRWLDDGVELARSLKGKDASRRDVIWSLLCDAVQTMDGVPDQERRWLTSGTRSGGWTMVGMSLAELQELEKLRLFSAMKPYDGEAKTMPQSADVDRALGVLGWLRWLNETRMGDRLKKASIVLARNGEVDAVHRIYRPHRKPSRQTVYEIKVRTVGHILNGLRRDVGIGFGPGITFQAVADDA